MYHFIGIYNIVSVIHHNTQQSVMDRVKIIIQRHKNNYFKNWSTQELTFPQYLLQYLLQYYTQVNNYFFKSQYWNKFSSIVHYTSIPVLWSPSTGDPSFDTYLSSSFSYSFWKKKKSFFFCKMLIFMSCFRVNTDNKPFWYGKEAINRVLILNIGKIYTIYIFHLVLKCLMCFFAVLNKFKGKMYQNWIKKTNSYIPSK